MKCPICDGMGTSNTCVNGTFKPCSYCDGTGECDANEVDRFNAVDFIKVMEMVKKPQTNEQWLRQANKEEMEHTLTMLIMKDRYFADKEFAYVNIRFGVHYWLKEEHKDA